MNATSDAALATTAPATLPAIRIARRLLHGMEAAPALRLWDDTLHVSDERAAPFTLVLRDPAVLRRLVIERNPLLLVDAYVRGAVDVEGDLYSALALKRHFESISLSWRDKLVLLRDALRLPARAEVHFERGSFASRVARRFSLRRQDFSASCTSLKARPRKVERDTQFLVRVVR